MPDSSVATARLARPLLAFASLLSVTLLTQQVSAFSDPEAERGVDSDRDGIPDSVEIRTNTDPLSQDTDGDGVKDSDEDINQDGVVDPGESDPRRPGIFPGSSPHIPEPIKFDMVRGMGASPGELEVNTLFIAPLTGGSPQWAPEIEWAFARGYAVEFELPMTGRRLDAFKLALQGTLPLEQTETIHGWQVFAEVGLDQGHTELVGLYMLGHRFNSTVSGLVMLGGVAELTPSLEHGSLLLNSSIFADTEEWQTIGLETNLRFDGFHAPSAGLYPQLHIQVSHRLRVQLTIGAELERAQPLSPRAGMRVIVE